MHNAPPVVFPVGRFVWGQRWLAGLALLGMLADLCWFFWAGPPAWLLVGVLLSWVLCIALAFALWRHERLEAGHLIWSGGDWLWRAHGQAERPVAVTLVWDASHAMLLAVAEPQAARLPPRLTRYAWLTQQEMPTAWHGFRCAVCARPGEDADNAFRTGT